LKVIGLNLNSSLVPLF